MVCRIAWRFVSLVLISGLAGCGFAPSSNLKTLQVENRRLGEEARALQAEVENVKTHTRQVENRLIQAEEQLAEVDSQRRRDRRSLAAFREEREELRQRLTSHPGAGRSAALARLVDRYANLKIDPATGIAKLETDVLFDTGQTELKSGAKILLEEFSAVMQDQQAQHLKVMVVGHTDDQREERMEGAKQDQTPWQLSTARAGAVALELIRGGLDGQRVGVAGFASHQPIVSNESYEARQRNRRVEIFVVDEDVPVIGMTETLLNLY